MLCLLVFVAIYLTIHFFGRLENFVNAHVPIRRMVPFLMYETPYIIVQMLPPSCLISAIILFSLMKKNNEIMAMKSCGLDILKICQIMIILSLVVGLTLFLLSEIIVPYTSSRSNKIWDIEVNKQDPTRFYGSNHIWYKGTDSIYWIKNFDSEKRTMENPTFYFFNKAFRLIKRIDARRGIWKHNVWKLEDGIIQQARDDGDYELSKFHELYLEIPETPETFVRDVKLPEDMSYRELKQYATRVRQEGYDNTRYLVDMNLKIAFPFVTTILVLIGIPIALGLKKGATPLAVSLGIGSCMLYTITLSFSRSLGLTGIFPPILSVWLPNLVFFFLGLYLMMGIER